MVSYTSTKRPNTRGLHMLSRTHTPAPADPQQTDKPQHVALKEHRTHLSGSWGGSAWCAASSLDLSQVHDGCFSGSHRWAPEPQSGSICRKRTGGGAARINEALFAAASQTPHLARRTEHPTEFKSQTGALALCLLGWGGMGGQKACQ